MERYPMANKTESKVNLVEAGGIVFSEFYVNYDGVDGEIKINMTGRGVDTKEALKNFEEGLAELIARGVVRTANKAMPKTKEEIPFSNEPHYEPIEATDTAKNGGTINVVKVTVEPQPDGKPRISFYQEGAQFAKYPFLSCHYMTPEGAVKFFEPLGFKEDAFTVANGFDVNFKLVWIESDKLNSKGNPYKNPIRIEK